MPLIKLSIGDLKQDAIQLFKEKAVKRGRLTDEEVKVSDTILMDNLHLLDEDGYLIRAAMLAFYHDPEKWVTGAYVNLAGIVSPSFTASTITESRYLDFPRLFLFFLGQRHILIIIAEEHFWCFLPSQSHHSPAFLQHEGYLERKTSCQKVHILQGLKQF